MLKPPKPTDHVHCDEQHGLDTSCIKTTTHCPECNSHLVVRLMPGGEADVESVRN